MATRSHGTIQTPTSGFQFTVHTLPNAAGLNPLPEGEVGFMEVDGLSDETEAVDFKDGNDLYTDKLPGQTKGSEITLKHGSDHSNYCEKWRAAVKERTVLPGQDYRNDTVITMWERQGAPGAGGTAEPRRVKSWLAPLAWPRALNASNLSGTSSEIHTLDMILCFKGALEVLWPPLS